MTRPNFPTRRALLAALALGLSLPALQGCLGVAAVGVGAGALAAADRRTLGTQTDDESIELKITNRITEKMGDRVHINVTSYNRRVLLSGEVLTEAGKAMAEQIVNQTDNVQGVWNELTVGPVSSFSARSNDTYVTSKVKARFIDANQFYPNHVKVVTEAGTVFLLGLVTEPESRTAIRVARSTDGVRKVVNLMQVISEAEARKLDATLKQSPAAKKTGAEQPDANQPIPGE